MIAGTSTFCSTGPAEHQLSETASTRPENLQFVANNLSESRMRDFFDPIDKYNQLSTELFIDTVAKTRATSTLRGFGKIAAHEVILAEGAHCLLDDDQSRGVALPVPQQRQHEITSFIKTTSLQAAKSISLETDKIIVDHKQEQDRLGVPMERLPSRLILSGQVMAAVAHADVLRRSGRQYFTHPEDVASIIRLAWRDMRLSPDDPLYEPLQFLAYTHDAPEDNIDAFGTYVGDTVPVTPLVAQNILQAHGVQDYRHAARALVYLMRIKDVDKQRLLYDKYIARGLEQPGTVGLYFTIAKGADNMHNLTIEPDPDVDTAKRQKSLANKGNYEQAMNDIINGAADRGRQVSNLVDAIFRVTRAEVYHESARNFRLDLAGVSRSVKQRVRAQD